MLLGSPPSGDEEGETRFAELAADKSTRRFAEGLIAVVIEEWDALDAAISEASRRWRLERMDRVDRNTLRIAAAELLRRDKTPRGVVLSEAVRLAAAYGNERSASFVNGISVTLASRFRPQEPSTR